MYGAGTDALTAAMMFDVTQKALDTLTAKDKKWLDDYGKFRDAAERLNDHFPQEGGHLRQR